MCESTEADDAAGAAAGAAGGYLWDQHKQAEEAAYRQGQADAKKQ